ncbi:MAG: thiamine-phosphate kinase [Alphaproteobacteria bacterium]|nr:thiamine-phosphate kinase [Alphaproteobacteria bacterium]
MATSPTAGEFELIARYFAPLARSQPFAYGLSDDVAWLRPAADCDLVLTADAMVAGVHFLADDPPDLVARKLLRVNLSDLAAKGARPLGYLMTTAWPRDIAEDWIAGFAAGLAQDQQEFDVALLGGDTVATDGPMHLSLTAVGEVPRGQHLRRGGGRPGDLVFVSGTIGDGALGLLAAKGGLRGLAQAERAFLADRYRLPRPRLALGAAVRQLASAGMDVSDGLVADLGHICEVSGVSAELWAGAVPLSPAAAAAIAREPGLRALTLTGGDDYELVFTIPADAAAGLAKQGRRLGVAVSQVGHLASGQGVRVIGADGRPLALERAGYRHF